MTRYRVCGGCGQPVAGKCPRCAPPPGRAGRSPSTRAQRGDGGEYERNRRRTLNLRPDGRPMPGAPTMCWWCQVREATTADHVKPVSRGGSNRLENLVPACRRCNLSRQANPDWRPPSSR